MDRSGSEDRPHVVAAGDTTPRGPNKEAGAGSPTSPPAAVNMPPQQGLVAEGLPILGAAGTQRMLALINATLGGDAATNLSLTDGSIRAPNVGDVTRWDYKLIAQRCVSGNGPYYMMICVVVLSELWSWVATMVWLAIALEYLNEQVRKEMALHERGRPQQFYHHAGIAMVNVVLFLFLLSPLQLHRSMMFMGTSDGYHSWLLTSSFGPAGIIRSVWEVACGAMVAKLILVAIKCVYAASDAAKKNTRRGMSRAFGAMDAAGAVYSSIYPLTIWLPIFLTNPSHTFPVRLLLLVLYCIAKYRITNALVLELFSVVARIRSGGPLFGVQANPDELRQPVECAICSENNTAAKASNTVKLSCQHFFCEACLMQWCDRDRRCPTCRERVDPAGASSLIRFDGTTNGVFHIF